MASKPTPVKKPQHGEIRFAHPSEQEFASILDFYGVRWEYEPKSFPLRWDAERVAEMFTPDFYLPDLGLYLELTTLKQSLVTEKNRKLRRMRELYPDVAVKLLYRRDYHRLLAKYGFGPLATADFGGVDRVLFSARGIADRVRQLGREISADYEGKEPVLVGVQRGMVCFMADLIRQITLPIEMGLYVGFILRGSSEGRRAGGLKDLDLGTYRAGHVLLIEDIVDTGMTLNYLLNYLRVKEPATLSVCTLVDKRIRRIVDVDIRYVGFEVGDEFLVGYGLDHMEKYRNLPFLGGFATRIGGLPRTKKEAPRNLALRSPRRTPRSCPRDPGPVASFAAPWDQ